MVETNVLLLSIKIVISIIDIILIITNEELFEYLIMYCHIISWEKGIKKGTNLLNECNWVYMYFMSLYDKILEIETLPM